MKTSAILVSRILRTRKKLSNQGSYQAVICIGFLGLIGIFTFALHAVSRQGLYGAVYAEIPVVGVDLKDPALHSFDERASTSIEKTTPVIVMTAEAFYFGDLNAFGRDFYNVRNKFFIKHDDGEPQLGKLLDLMTKWQGSRSTKAQADEVVVFLPSGNIPAPIVVQVVAGLKRSPIFERVVLATGMM